jgi:hypothetical protein
MVQISQRTVTVHRRLRPLRLAFLVRPSDKAALRRVFQINTCFWGGRFNPIIPIFKKTPRWWAEKPFPAPSARAVANGYLDAFEPDYVVCMADSLADGLSVPKEHVLREKDVLDPDEDEPTSYGVDVAELYQSLYREEFQFQRRHSVEVILPQCRDGQMALLVRACFGEFPPDESLKYLLRVYCDAFDAKTIEVDRSNLFTLLLGHDRYPLRMGGGDLEVQRRGWIADPALFYMDATSTIDLIDYWNLRALGWRVLPVLRQWADALAAQCSDFVGKNHVPYRHNKEMMHSTTLLRARSVPLTEVQAYAKQLKTPGAGSLIVQHWYPRVWDEWARDKDHALRPDVMADEEDIEVSVINGAISFRDLAPDFVDRFGGQTGPRWANVVQIRDYLRSVESAPVIPPGLSDISRLLGDVPLEGPWATREGIVIGCKYLRWTHRWTIPTGFDVFKAWTKGHGFELELSDAGKLAAQVVRALGGVWRIHLLAHEEIIRLLNNMASGAVESEVEEGQNGAKRRKVRSKIVKVGEWRLRLRQINDGQDERGRGHLEALVSHKVLEVGLRLQCPICNQGNWYSPTSLTEQLTCERCPQSFSFPATGPPPDAWYYRAVGPFSVEDYARGSYCVTLALRFLGDVLRAEQTWVPSFILKRTGNKELETDFAAFWRRSSFDENEPMLILGECKSYGRFEPKDIKKMRGLGKQFPGAVLAFCTFRKSLKLKEKKLLAPLARGGRKHLRAERWRNPVLVLTGMELFSDFLGPPNCWKAEGGDFAKFAEKYRPTGNLTELCEATQQLHLGIESYWEWLEQQRIRRVRRIEQARARQTIG